MAARKAFLLRLDPRLHAALERWSADELRSVNGQIEFLLRRALLQANRLDDRRTTRSDGSDGSDGNDRNDLNDLNGGEDETR